MSSETDPNLIELLDDALNDFQPPPSKTNDDDLEEFMQRVDHEATQKAAENFQSMLEGVLLQRKEGTSSKDPQNMGESISNLIFNDNICDEKLEQELEKLSLSKDSIDDLMDTIVQTAVSKQAMYPAIKEMHAKFGPFIEEKSMSLDTETLRRYKEQYRILGSLRIIYEEESSGSNEEETKQARATKIAQLWMEMQKYGLPPPELAAQQGFNSEQQFPDDDNLNGCLIM